MFDPVELARGRQVELEHVDELSFAEEIAKDHLREHPRYYSRLKECDVEGSEGRLSCPTCHRNPRAHASEDSYYMLDEWVCSRCGWSRLISPEYEMQMKRAHCPQCGHRGLVKVPDELVDTRWRPQENPGCDGIAVGMKFILKPAMIRKHGIRYKDRVFTVSHIVAVHLQYASAQTGLPQVLMDADDLPFSVTSDEVEFVT
jgi:DNA-directed RNA polymerase subunit RPC12/RpoP